MNINIHDVYVFTVRLQSLHIMQRAEFRSPYCRPPGARPSFRPSVLSGCVHCDKMKETLLCPHSYTT